MQDFLVAIIIAWILFRLVRPVVFIQWNKPQKHYHNYYPGAPNQSAEEEIKITKEAPPAKNDDSDKGGEYVDFEELPKS